MEVVVKPQLSKLLCNGTKKSAEAPENSAECNDEFLCDCMFSFHYRYFVNYWKVKAFLNF